MRTINKVIIVGNVTRDPEIKTTTNGQPIATFGVATNRTWVTSSGERKSSAEFHNIVVWGKLAEICQDFLRKGELVYIEGYLKTRTWDNESGLRSYRTEIVADDVIRLTRDKQMGDRAEGNDTERAEGASDMDMSNPPASSTPGDLDDLI